MPVTLELRLRIVVGRIRWLYRTPTFARGAQKGKGERGPRYLDPSTHAVLKQREKEGTLLTTPKTLPLVFLGVHSHTFQLQNKA